MKYVYVQTSDGKWHIKGVHEMGLVRLKGKVQKHFPSTGEVCPICKEKQHNETHEHVVGELTDALRGAHLT